LNDRRRPVVPVKLSPIAARKSCNIVRDKNLIGRDGINKTIL
jgi:hypothetical protein